jgi:hypothetical protein
MIVEDRYIGNARVKIDDEYCRGKTPEDARRILGRIAEITLPAMQAAEAAQIKKDAPAG